MLMFVDLNVNWLNICCVVQSSQYFRIFLLDTSFPRFQDISRMYLLWCACRTTNYISHQVSWTAAPVTTGSTHSRIIWFCHNANCNRSGLLDPSYGRAPFHPVSCTEGSPGANWDSPAARGRSCLLLAHPKIHLFPEWCAALKLHRGTVVSH